MNIKSQMKRLKKCLLVFGVAGMLNGVFAPLLAHAHDAYFLSITIDADNRKFIGIVSHDKNDTQVDTHAEVSNTGAYFGAVKRGGKNMPSYKSVSGNTTGKYTIPVHYASQKLETVGSAYSKLFPFDNVKQDDKKVNPNTLIFSFPGVHYNSARSMFTDKKRDGDNQDRQQAQWVNANLVGSLNQTIGIVYPIVYSSRGDQRMRMIEISQLFANAGSNVAGVNGNKSGAKQTVQIGRQKFVVSDGREVPNRTPDIPADHYIKITNKNMDDLYVPWAVPKGYGKDQRLWSVIKGSNYEKEFSGQDAQFLSWQHVAMQGIYNSAVNGVEFGGADKLNPPNFVERTIAEVFNSMINAIESILGLSSIPELMLNRGSYAVSTWKGVMPKGLAEVADYVHLFVQMIAWTLLAGAFAKLLTMRNLSALNPKMRVDLKEGAVDLIGAGFALLMFIPIFRSLLTLNEGLVMFFGGMSDQADNFGSALMTNGGYIGPIIVGLVFFLLLIYLNITYMLRGITIAALYCFAPLFIVSIAYGGRFKQLFSTFAKELVGMIFIQSIHALLLGVYSLAFYNGASSGMLYTIILTASFIPITKFIKKDLLGINETMGSQIAGGAVSAGAGFAIASVGAATMGAKMRSNSSDSSGGEATNFGHRSAGSGGGGNGGGGGGTFQNMMDNDAGAGNMPSHYTGDNAYKAEMKPAKPGFVETAKESVRGIGNQAKKYDAIGQEVASKVYNNPVTQTGLKAAGTVMKGAAFAAAATSEMAMGTNGISSTATRAMISGGMYRGMKGKGGSGGDSGYGSGGMGAVPIPNDDFLDQYAVGEDGFVVSAGKENGDILNVHNKEKLMEERGYEEMFDNGDQLMMKTSINPSENEALNKMYEVFKDGSDIEKQEWQERGVDFAMKTDDDKLLIGLNKRALGINNVQQNDKHIMFDTKPTTDTGFLNYNLIDGKKYDNKKPTEEPKTQTA